MQQTNVGVNIESARAKLPGTHYLVCICWLVAWWLLPLPRLSLLRLYHFLANWIDDSQPSASDIDTSPIEPAGKCYHYKWESNG